MTHRSRPSCDVAGLASAGLPQRAGAGFKPQHLAQWLADPDAPAFSEVHAENYMGAGGPPHRWLTQMREHRPLSIHGVGLSIGGTTALDRQHLDRLSVLLARYQPQSFSEHLAWSTHSGRYLNDLLPLPYDSATLDRVCAHVQQVQDHLRVRMLLENPSTYFEFATSTLSEPEFIAQILRRTGCGLLLDVNNVYVSCINNGHDPHRYLDALPLSAVGEIHLAGHFEERFEDGASLLVDHHGAPVPPAVWELYARVIAVTGPVPTLIEWDNEVPDYPTLRAQARNADRIMDLARGTVPGAAA